jgi:Zn-finger nucleic acid-binding protein
MQQQMTCPKCMGVMRQFERSGVIVDQCTECRGIFLDRGELEKLVDAEDSYYGKQPQAQAQPQQHQQYQQQYQQPRYEDRRYDSHGHGDYRHKKKKHSFFEELFD